MPVASLTEPETTAAAAVAVVARVEPPSNPAVAAEADPAVVFSVARNNIKDYVKRYYYSRKIQMELRAHFKKRYPRASSRAMRRVIHSFINWLVSDPLRAANVAENIFINDSTVPVKSQPSAEELQIDR